VTSIAVSGWPSLLRGRGVPPDAPLCRDSRRVEPGAAFFACADDPTERAGHVAQALDRGARWVITPPGDRVEGAAQITCAAPRRLFARASAAAHGLVGAGPPLHAVTGTDGKTTVAELTRTALGPSAARIGTLGWHDGRREHEGTHTTPPPELIHAFLAGLGDGCSGVALEASSHAGAQGRLAGLELRSLVFTGLGGDHLDYHRDHERYLRAKLRLCDGLGPDSWCFINADGAHAAAFAERARARLARAERVVGIGFSRGRARLRRDGGRWYLAWDGGELKLPQPLPGDFNAWNAAAAFLVAHVAAGLPAREVLARLATCPGVPGRCELLARDPWTYVDYAHTPEALSRIVAVLRVEHPGARLVCVFGCGGNRDRGKRGPMGRAAAAADVAVLTTDNPRGEDPVAIAGDVLAGVDESDRARMRIEPDRGSAIDLAREEAGHEGVVVVCGKGHETHQEVGARRLRWSDRDHVRGLRRGGG